MRFICDKCGNIKDIYKVKFTYIKNEGLVCKDAFCCDLYMQQEISEEYEGMPEIRRNDSAMNDDKLWNNFKYNNTK